MQGRITTTVRAPDKRSKHFPQCLAMLWFLAGCGADSDAWPGPLAGAGTQPTAASPAGGGGIGGAGGAAADGVSGGEPQPPAVAGAKAEAEAGSSSAAAGAAAMPDPTTVPTEPAITRPPGWQATSHERGAMPDYARLFADDRVHRIDIELSAESKQAMYDDLEMLLGDDSEMGGAPFPGWGGMGEMPTDPTDLIGGDPIYVPVTVKHDGRVWTQVGMRFKGNSSLASAWRSGVRKIGFRLDFDRYEMEHPETTDQRFYGFGKMTFSSNYGDPSQIRDKLAAEVLDGLGLVAARCAFYQIYVDSGGGAEYWGLYTMIEDPADQLVEAQFADKSGNLYKPDGPGADWTMFDMKGFEKKSNEEAADYGDVMAAIAALHAPRTDAQAWRDGLEAVFNVQGFLDVLAFSRAIGHWDGYGIMAHNYYLYGDPVDAGRLLWISWDHNLSWRAGGGFFGGLSVMMDEIGEEWPLIRYVMDDSVYRTQYQQALRASLGGPYEKAAFDARAKQLHALVAPYVVGGDGVMGEQMPYTFLVEPAEFHDALSAEDGMIPAADSLRDAVLTALAP